MRHVEAHDEAHDEAHKMRYGFSRILILIWFKLIKLLPLPLF
jgi:hypothetical protein